MNVDRLADRMIGRASLTSAEAAAKRFQQHMLNWGEDLDKRRDFYTHVVEAKILELPRDQADILRAAWQGQIDFLNAQSDEERAAIEARVNPLLDAPTPDGEYSWFGCLMDCPGGYLTDPEVRDEMKRLVQVPGFYEARDRLTWPDENPKGLLT